MFWKQNYSTSSPQMEALLNNENVTLTELMDEDEILQECASQNKKLVDFLLRPKVLEELVTLITTEPPTDIPETSRYKYPNMACEILTSDMPSINERLSGDGALLGKLYAFLEQEPPLNPLLCSFFSKTLGMLIGRHSKQNWYSYQFTCLQVLEFLKGRDNCIKRMLCHIATPAIMDLLFKLITQVEGHEMRLNVLNWLDSQEIVQNLVTLLKPDVDSDIHSNVSYLLCDVIRAGREARIASADGPETDPILNTLESTECVDLLLNCILNEKKSESGIIGGIQIILTLIELPMRPDPSSNVSRDDSTDKELQSKIVGAIIPRLKDFHDILINPPTKPSIRTTAGLLDPPFGNTRLHVSRLMVALVASGSADIPLALSKEGIINTLLNLFFQYSWNNFLHSQVEQCLSLIISQKLEIENLKPTGLQINLFGECRLIQRILEAWENNDMEQSKSKGVRQGYMGHLVKIANHIDSVTEEGPLKDLLTSTLSENPDIQDAWLTFIEGPLLQTNETQKILLGGSHPSQCNADDSNDEFREIPFPATNIHPQITFLESYANSINDDDFGDEDVLHSVDRINTISFNISEEELTRQAKLFNQVCSQSINTLDINSLDDSDDNIWEENSELSFTNSGLKDVIGNQPHWFLNPDGGSGDNPSSGEKAMDIDNAWGTISEASVTVPPVVTVSPWGVDVREPIVPIEETQQGWADFSSNSFAEFETSFSGSISTPDPEISDSECNKTTEEWKGVESFVKYKIEQNTYSDEDIKTEIKTNIVIDSNPLDEIKSSDSDDNANTAMISTTQDDQESSDKTVISNVIDDHLTDNHRFLANQELPVNELCVRNSESKIEVIKTKTELMVTSELTNIETVLDKNEFLENGPVENLTETTPKTEIVLDNKSIELAKLTSVVPVPVTTDNTLNGPV